MASHNVVLLPGPLSALHAYLRAFVSSVVLLTVMGRQAKPFLPSSLCLLPRFARSSVRSFYWFSLAVLLYYHLALSTIPLISPTSFSVLSCFSLDFLVGFSRYPFLLLRRSLAIPSHCIPTPVSYFLIPSSFGLPNVLTSHSVSDHPCTLFFMYSSVYWKVKSYILGSSLV